MNKLEIIPFFISCLIAGLSFGIITAGKEVDWLHVLQSMGVMILMYLSFIYLKKGIIKRKEEREEMSKAQQAILNHKREEVNNI